MLCVAIPPRMAIFTLQSGPANARFFISRWLLIGLVVLLIGPWTILGGWLLYSTVRRDAAKAATTGMVKCQPGPWGDLEFSRILIEPPEEFIVADYTRPDALVWHFKGYTPDTLAKLFDDAGLDAAQRHALEDPAKREMLPDRILIHPDRDLVIGLKPAQRAKLYAALSAFEENGPQNNPYRMRPDAVAQWFVDTGLSPETVALTQKMFYSRTDTAMCFADDDIILPTLDLTERVKFIKALSRKSTLLPRLRVGPETNIEALANYWGRGRHKKDIKPLLQSVARLPGGGTLDISHLLPAFARGLLYTYPQPPANPNDMSHDCHWTSFNFFNDVPDEKFSDIANIQKAVAENYAPATGLPAFGDILMFVHRDGVVVHSCVYIADNIVFTKNGPAFSVPWQFATLDGVMSFYSVGAPVEIRRYRMKNS